MLDGSFCLLGKKSNRCIRSISFLKTCFKRTPNCTKKREGDEGSSNAIAVKGPVLRMVPEHTNSVFTGHVSAYKCRKQKMITRSNNG